ncbi:unnamed protein product, partial [Polarella glacialis]
LANRRRRMDLGAKAREELKHTSADDLASNLVKYKEDLIPIQLHDLTFHRRGRKILDCVNIAAPQGSVVAVISDERAGKATLMRLLSQSLMPQEGTVFVPPHLRILQVCDAPHLVPGNLLANLTFGVSIDKHAVEEHHPSLELIQPARLRDICMKLGMGAGLLQQLQKETAE